MKKHSSHNQESSDDHYNQLDIKAHHLLVKLNESGSLLDLEKIQLRNAFRQQNIKPDKATAEYLEIKKSNGKWYKPGFYFVLIAVIIITASSIYGYYFVRKTQAQTVDLYSQLNSIKSERDTFKKEKESLQELLNRSGSELSQANQKISSLQNQLN